MPYADHPGVATPNDNCHLWRYMDLTKFLSLIQTSTLFFPSVASLALVDSYEGLYTHVNVAADTLTFEQLSEAERLQTNIQSQEQLDLSIWAQKGLREFARKMRDHTAVSCWHEGESESVAMWNIYAKRSYGICISATLGGLKSSLSAHSDDQIYVGRIRYIDYGNEHIPPGYTFAPVLHKRKSYEYEREVRAFFCRLPTRGGPIDYTAVTMPASGVAVRVDLDLLIDRILVSPDTPEFVLDVIRDAATKYGLTKPVTQSSLADAAPH